MLRVTRLVLLLVLLAISITTIYPHGQQWWYDHPDMGWFGSLGHEWGIAKWPMIVAIVVIIAVIYLEAKSSCRDEKKEKARDELLKSMDISLKKIVKKLGADDNDKQ